MAIPAFLLSSFSQHPVAEESFARALYTCIYTPHSSDNSSPAMKGVEVREPRRWLITGVSSGIGEALARTALDRGDVVHGSARKEADVARIEAIAPGRSIGIQLDVTVPESIAGAVGRAG